MVHSSDGRVNVTAHPPPGYGKMKVEGSGDSDHKNDKRMTDSQVEGGMVRLQNQPQWTYTD